MRSACAFVAIAAAAQAVADARTFYVQAGRAKTGLGTARAPFKFLLSAEARSRPGDRIVVLPAPRSVPPLPGGIRLKPRQQLVGAGPAVAGRDRDRAPRLTNTDPGRLDGDAVRLASGATVRNLVISGSRRGGVYGLDVAGVRVEGNDVSHHNTSCTRGFHIPPFNVPTIAAGVVIPISEGLSNGWAGIMVDAERAAGRLTIRGNVVHDAECGDGIDIRASGSADLRAEILGNTVRDLRESEDFESLLAIGVQTRDRARLVARIDRNRQAGLGNDEDVGVGPTGGDTEGVFVNPVGPSTMRVAITRNTYTHVRGRGGFSANGLEFVSMGDGTRAVVDIRESTFSGTPGDVIEQLALGTNAHLKMRVDRVTATASTGFGGSGVGDTIVIPGNNADCLIGASGGAGNTVELFVRRSTLTDCANNGMTFGSSVANGRGPTRALKLEVLDSTITGNHGGNLRIGNIGGLDSLSVKVEGTNLSNSRGAGFSPANLVAEDRGTTGRATIDFGGGALGSRGGNCFAGGKLAALLAQYDVRARGNCWGRPGGAGHGRVVSAGGALDDAGALGSAPSHC